MITPYTKLSRSPRLTHKRWAGLIRLAMILIVALALLLGLTLVSQHWDPPELFFFGLTLLVCGCETYWLIGPYLNAALPPRSRSADQHLELFTPDNFLFAQRRLLRMFMHGLLILSSLAISVHLASFVPKVHPFYILAFYIFGLIFLEWFTSEGIRHFNLGHYWIFWLAANMVIGASVGYSFFLVEKDIALSVVAGFVGLGIAVVIYVSKRMDISEYVWFQVIGHLITTDLKSPHSQQDFDLVVTQIATRLGYEHVSLLRIGPDLENMSIAAEYSLGPSAKGHLLSIQEGITGRAFRTGKTCAWNDTSRCPYYKSLVESKKTATRAEIAVPIVHDDEILGILDVQSRTPMVFGPGDIRSLEVIAHIFGSAWAAAKTDNLIVQGTQLWDKLSGEIHSEDDVFRIFSEFALKDLEADLVVYYRLSPTGLPINPPQIAGKLLEETRMRMPVYNLESPLYDLIRDWKPVYEEDVREGGYFLRRNSPDNPGFARREGIRSAFFIPIGLPDERMAVAFLNYRHRKVFNGLLQLTIQGFAQGFATTLAKEIYRDQLFHGLARPELGVHNILGRYGMKDGVMQEGRKLFETDGRSSPEKTEQLILQLLQDVDNCFVEIRSQTTRVSLNWESSLLERIDDLTRKIKEHVPVTHTVRFIKKIDPLVERESAWTRLALYRIIEEAVNNAIFHGEATEIKITLVRAEKAIKLEVENNGHPLPLDAVEKHSSSGIYEILEEIRNRFSASAQVVRIENGTLVKVLIPGMPIPKEESLL